MPIPGETINPLLTVISQVPAPVSMERRSILKAPAFFSAVARQELLRCKENEIISIFHPVSVQILPHRLNKRIAIHIQGFFGKKILQQVVVCHCERNVDRPHKIEPIDGIPSDVSMETRFPSFSKTSLSER